MNRRKFNRKQCIFSIFQSDHNGKGSGGVILDMSENGANILVNTTSTNVDSDFHISIYPAPGIKHMDFIEINAHKVWENDSGINNYKKIGCKFKSLTNGQKKKVHKLID